MHPDVFTMGMIGNISLITSVGIIPAFGFACYTFLAFLRKGIPRPLLGAAAFTLIALILIRNSIEIPFL
jgi:hypothetical protein